MSCSSWGHRQCGNLMCWFMVLWFIGYKSQGHEKPLFNGLCNSTSLGKLKSSIMSKCHRVIWCLGNHKIIEKGEKGIGGNAWWFWIMIIQEADGKVVTTIKEADLIQPLIGLRIKSIRLMAFNQNGLSAFISIQLCNS